MCNYKNTPTDVQPSREIGGFRYYGGPIKGSTEKPLTSLQRGFEGVKGASIMTRKDVSLLDGRYKFFPPWGRGEFGQESFKLVNAVLVN